jgi:phosphate transport system protein
LSRELFHRSLVELQDEVLALGSMAEKAILDAMEALRDGDHRWSRKLIEDDDRINAKRFAIEDRIIHVIALQAPIASDLRALVSMLFIVTDLERIADHAEGIAKINMLLEDEPLPRRLGYLPSMADRSVTMLRDSLKAFIDHDTEAARRICEADDEVDRLQDRVYEDTFAAMLSDPRTIQRNTYMLWCAHNLERIADRCTNICERLIYLVTGELLEINVSKY